MKKYRIREVSILKKIRFENALIWTPEGYLRGGFSVHGSRFANCFKDESENDRATAENDPKAEIRDLQGRKVLPGLIDIHIHGCAGADFSDGTFDSLKRMSKALAKEGVTSFTPASMTLPYERLAKAYAVAGKFREEEMSGSGARLMGINMEGPWFSMKRKGAQNAAWLRKPDFGAFYELYRESGEIIRIADVAPELPGAESFAKKASEYCVVSAAHTDSDYLTAKSFFEAGASHLTHLFNAMPPFLHRDPGVIGAAMDDPKVTAELICDGLHVHPSAVRAAFRMFPGRICLISDALRCAMMPEGVYELGGQQVFLKDGIARLANGTIAGSATNLFEGLRRAIAFGIPETEAVCAATVNPAKVIGAESEIGTIEDGKLSDFVICSNELKAEEVYVGGCRV